MNKALVTSGAIATAIAMLTLTLSLLPFGGGFGFGATQAAAQTAQYSYGEWSSNKTTTQKPTESDTLRIVSTSTKYTYFRYCNFYENKWQQDSVEFGEKHAYHERTLAYPLTACPNKFPDHGGKAYDLHGPYDSCEHKRVGQSYWWTKSIVTTYTYQTRTKQRVSFANKGTISGLVYSASSKKKVSGAKIYLYTTSGSLVQTCTSKSNGSYTLYDVTPGTYYLKVKKNGYLLLRVTVKARKGSTTFCDNALLIKTYTGSGAASGYIKSATTGKGLKNVTVYFKKCWNNPKGTTVKTARTDSKGKYTVRLKAGYYTAVCKSSSYITVYFNIIVKKGTTSNQNCSTSPAVTKGKYRAVLTWGHNPADLDSHLVSPKTGGFNYHVFYARKTLGGSKSKLANLDVDDTTSYGPETITFALSNQKKYNYYVYRFSNSGSLAASNATVRLYKGSKLIKTYHVPTSGSGRFWNVFSISGGKLKTINTLTNSPVGVRSSFAKEGARSLN